MRRGIGHWGFSPVHSMATTRNYQFGEESGITSFCATSETCQLKYGRQFWCPHLKTGVEKLKRLHKRISRITRGP